MEKSTNNNDYKPIVSEAMPKMLKFKNLNFKNKFWKNISLLAVVIVVAGIGTYIFLGTHAASPSVTKVWSTTADWNSGTLSNATVSNNSVMLASITKGTAPTYQQTSQQANLALRRPAYASSVQAGGYPAKAAFDGNMYTRWSSQFSDPQWLYVDLGSTYNVNQVKIYWERACGKAFQIQVSNDASSWTTIYSTTTGTGGLNNLTNLSGVGRYVRMYGTARCTQWGYSIYEMQVYGSPVSSVSYASSGNITLDYNASSNVNWTSLAATDSLPAGTNVTIQARSSANNSTWSSWYTSANVSQLPSGQYIQIQAALSSTNSTVTPLLNSLTLVYSPIVLTPTATLSVNPTTITAGQSATLSWSSTNTTSCTASGAWSGTLATSGSQSTGALSQTSTYNIACSGTGGTITATTAVTVNPVVSSSGRPAGLIQAGNSKTVCITNGPNPNNYSQMDFTTLNGITYNCMETFSDAMPTWADWVNPWIDGVNGAPFVNWVKADPNNHSLIDAQNLIPDSEASNPNWTAECAAGDYNTYATQFSQNMVAAGLGNTVIRLAHEMNGTWYNDDLGSTQAQWTQWDQCWDQEVTAMRAVPGADFLFDWNVNSNYQNFPLANIYPGNAYVDIIGIDQYDGSGDSNLPASGTARWNYLYNEADGIATVEAFAVANNKPLSIPEWGTSSGAQPAGGGDDGAYVTGIANFVANHNVAYQSYFDANVDSILPLDPSVAPNTTSAYVAAFGGTQ